MKSRVLAKGTNHEKIRASFALKLDQHPFCTIQIISSSTKDAGHSQPSLSASGTRLGPFWKKANGAKYSFDYKLIETMKKPIFFLLMLTST